MDWFHIVVSIVEWSNDLNLLQSLIWQVSRHSVTGHGHADVDFNRCSVFTESCFLKSLFRFPLLDKKSPTPAKFLIPPPGESPVTEKPCNTTTYVDILFIKKRLKTNAIVIVFKNCCHIALQLLIIKFVLRFKSSDWKKFVKWHFSVENPSNKQGKRYTFREYTLFELRKKYLKKQKLREI